jgi:GDP-L-fucose synthase
VYLGSSCVYPRLCPQPIKEEYLLTGPLEPTNAPYAVAKIAGITLCQAYNDQYRTNFITCMPTNLYGPGDLFDVHNSHVIPALIAKMYDAKIKGKEQVTIWGDGQVRREFLYVDDCAHALVTLMRQYNDKEIINIGTGTDVTIAELACMIKQAVGFDGELVFDTSGPAGVPQKLLDVKKIQAVGWSPTIGLHEGLQRTVAWYVQHTKEMSDDDVVLPPAGKIRYVMRG